MRRQHLATNPRSRLLPTALLLCVSLTISELFSRPVAPLRLEVAPDGKVWIQPEGKLLIHFVGSESKGYDVIFEAKEGEKWSPVAAFPQGKVWTLYNQWNAHAWDRRWYSGEHGFRALQVGA